MFVLILCSDVDLLIVYTSQRSCQSLLLLQVYVIFIFVGLAALGVVSYCYCLLFNLLIKITSRELAEKNVSISPHFAVFPLMVSTFAHTAI